MRRLRFAVIFVSIFAFGTIFTLSQSGVEEPHFRPASSGSTIKGIGAIGEKGHFAFTDRTIFFTRGNVEEWSKLRVDLASGEDIAGVYFFDKNNVRVVLNDRNTGFFLATTVDGGETWTRSLITIGSDDLREADVGRVEIKSTSPDHLVVRLSLASSSNFLSTADYATTDDGKTWNVVDRLSEPTASQDTVLFTRLKTDARLSSEENVIAERNGWLLTQNGTCFGSKADCIQETKIRRTDGKDVTPPEIKQLADIEKENARNNATPLFAFPPGGATRISLNRGFDQCNAPSAASMQTWWNNSPLYDMNIYMSGRNRACSAQPNLSAAWVTQVSAMGWGLIPTVVGYQSPCTASTTTAKLSYDVAMAETQGRGEADIAVTDATNLGLTTGSILYYDMERYDPPSPDTLGCRPATIAFLKGWTERIHELGYKSGTYGSPKNAQEDWVTLPPASKMDAIWMARWDNNPSVWTYLSFPTFPTTEWNNHQRIKQWQAPHNETWGGITFNIDGNNADGPVAGIVRQRSKNADFDGDGKSDVSVYRPSEGIWYVLSSIDFSLSAVGFGNATDQIAPGDFDGDGKTDYAVFRPADGYWHMQTKANTYSTRQFGATGDIPVAADYNGDGKTDLAVFRPSTGVWYIANSDSLGTFTFVQFGQTGDKPVPGDYDGDGKTDIAVWRPSDGIWYILRSSDQGLRAIGFGLSSDLPAQGDYDGDGTTDLAVYRDGYWYVLGSTVGFSVVPFGLPGDTPVTGDFDGDNKADVAVFRASAGAWFILQSQSGFTAYGFGNTTDRPVEAAYLPQ